ncbi:hypothetical protein SAMN05660649_00486 [Desulfotomaculum arcticum]|uniref:Uncharacterized protein n=1 Tax=Desulfotruncus arcticus DSM 17038 TaxID=1121424 RepID=A0A1I2NK72_9FIRM|nr:hypothetical protein [Desulfotruncus arcticus]SFG01701.1 hypothetical protein SAMN05660649_00486 [Desulfotomaculum arcticum] [Desulfotruncus arcticus DSM 17038]
MTYKEFVNILEQQRKAFVVHHVVAEHQLEVLKLFEHWVKEKLPQTIGNERKGNKSSEKNGIANKEFGVFLEDVIAQARELLARRGINIYCISLGKTINSLQSSKCIRVFKDVDVFYRVYKSIPRKGQYKGQKLLTIELVMDGYKGSVFLPLLQKKDFIEKHMGMAIERETLHVENTGRYRFRLCFPFTVIPEQEHGVQYMGHILSEYIFITGKYMKHLGLSAGQMDPWSWPKPV